MRSEWPPCTLKIAGWSGWICHFAVRWNVVLKRGETDMGDKGGSKDKGKREKQKKAQLSPKEKKKLKAEKKKKK